MQSDISVVAKVDPNQLIHDAMALFNAQPMATRSEENAAEAAIRRAHELVSPDLYVIEQLKQAGLDPNYESLFAKNRPEKIAALAFLTKHKLLDIEHCTVASLDTDDARRDLSSYVETLFRLQAVDALKLFFDFAMLQRDSRAPQLWRNVASRCLYLMSLMLESGQKVIEFLEERPDVREMVRELATTTTGDVRTALQRLIENYNSTLSTPGHTAEHTEPAPYLVMIKQYDQQAPDGVLQGFTSLLTAQDRIRQAVDQKDIPALATWIAQGSPAAMQTAFRQATTTLPLPQYITLLETTLKQPELDPLRKAIAVLELGTVNRTSFTEQGSPHVNRILAEVAAAADSQAGAVGQLAVRELAAVKAFPELQHLLDVTDNLVVAEEAINMLSDIRRLPVAESIVAKRPELAPALNAARCRFIALQQLVDSACSCRTEEMAEIYLTRLKQLNAVTELEQIGNMNCPGSNLAQQMLNELRPDLPITRRKY